MVDNLLDKDIGDVDSQRRDSLLRRKQHYIDEENHHTRLARVFGSAEGTEVLEWLLEQTGFWRSRFDNDRNLGLHEFAHKLFNEVMISDTDLAHRVMSRRVAAVVAEVDREKRQLNKELKEIK